MPHSWSTLILQKSSQKLEAKLLKPKGRMLIKVHKILENNATAAYDETGEIHPRPKELTTHRQNP